MTEKNWNEFNDIEKIQYKLAQSPYKEVLTLLKEEENQVGGIDGLIIESDELQFFVKTFVDFLILDHVFIKKAYDFLFTSPTIVVDIGANNGYSALWFAKNKNVKKVFAFEPVKPTYELAIKSIQLNPSLKEKIDLRNEGLSNKDTESSILYYEEHHTISSTLFTGTSENKNAEKPTCLVDIKLIDAKRPIEEIIEYKKDSTLLLKIDCEGSEYEIFDSFTSRIFNSIDIIMMELHGKNYQELLNLLLKHEFMIFSINHNEHYLFDHLCDVYAIKRTSLINK
jgi:FkbM family methyltransferase